MAIHKWSTNHISAALLGISILGIVEGLLGQETLTEPLQLSLYAFAFSLPLLAFSLFSPGYSLESFGNGLGNSNWNFRILIIELFGWLATITGLVAIIWYLSKTAVFIFIVSVGFALTIVVFIPLISHFISIFVNRIKSIFSKR